MVNVRSPYVKRDPTNEVHQGGCAVIEYSLNWCPTLDFPH